MLIKTDKAALREGIFLNKYFKNRLISRNQNLLLAITGGTGSGKSYACLRIAELWYKEYFKQDFPKEHICFTIEQVMRVLSQKEKKLRKGDLIIFEEAGVNMGSLDFQNKISKMFTYVLQSFRSMNVGILMNLPVLTMLNKSARLLLHSHMITAGIDYENKMCKLKPFFNQLNQQTGKIYSKYLKVKVGTSILKVQRFNYALPSKELVKEYETMKLKFVSDFNTGFLEKIVAENKAEEIKMARDDLTAKEHNVYVLLLEGLNQTEIAKKINITPQGVSKFAQNIKKKGYNIHKGKIPKENNQIKV